MSNPFSNSTKIVAASVVSKVLDAFDDPLPGIVAGATITKQDLTKAIVEYTTDGFFRRTERFFKYGRDHFVRGLPEQVTYDGGIDQGEIRRVIEGLNGGAKIQIIYSYINDEPDLRHHAMQYVQDVRLLNSVTNKIGNKAGITDAPIGIDVYFFRFNDTDTLDYLKIIYVYDEPGGGATIQLTENPPPMSKDNYLWQVCYKVLDSSGAAITGEKFFTYIIGTGTYPTLEQGVVLSEPVPSEYYPVIPFYEDKTQIGDPVNKGTPLYDTSKRAVEKLGLDYEEVVESLVEGTEESIGKDKGLYAYLALSAEVTAGLPKFADASKTTEEKFEILKEAQATLTYLIEYFKYLSTKQTITKEFWLQSEDITFIQALPTKNVILIQDNHYKHKLLFNYIEVTEKTGSIGEINWCTTAFTSRNKTYSLYSQSNTQDEGSRNNSFTIYYDTLTYRKQLTETTYIEVVVDGLMQSMDVFNGTDASNTPRNAFEEDYTLVTVPLHRPTVLKVKFSLRNRLMHASLVFIFNAYQKIEVKWYQSAFWPFLINVIGLIFALPTGGQSLTWSSVFTVAGMKAAMRAFLIYVFKYLLTMEVIKFIAKEFGAEVAFIISAIFIAYGKFGQNSSGVGGMPFATDALQVGTTMWSATADYLQEEYKDVLRDYEKLQTETEKLNKELEKAQKLLDTKMELDVSLFVNPLPDLMWGHTPDQFRAIRINPNPGLITLQSPNNYVELMLTLPTIDDTLKM